jgi:hypothetical protein
MRFWYRTLALWWKRATVTWLLITANLELKWWRFDMAKRSSVLDFLSSFNQTFDTVNKVGKDYEISKLANEKETAVYNPDQVNQRDAISGAVDAEGKPLYTVDTTPDGQTRVQSNVPGENGAQPAPFNIAAQGTQYMGKTYDRALTDSDRASAKNLAMSGIMSKYGDTEGAMRFQDSALRMQRQDKQDVRQDKQDAQGDQRFSWDKTRAEREQRTADQTEADATTMREIDAQVAGNFKKRTSNPDGTQRQVNADDLLSVTHEKANLLAKGGYIKDATALTDQYAASVSLKLKSEQAQREAALKNIAPGDYKAVAEYYNRFIPDGAQITATEPGKNGALVIKRAQSDGTQLPDKVLAKGDAELSAMLQQTVDSNAMTQFSANEFKNNLLLKADQRGAAQLGLAGNADRRAQANFEAEQPTREAAQEVAKLKIELAKTDDPRRQAELSDKITALSSGRRGASAQHDPADIAKAKALVAQNIYPNEGEALDAIVSKPDKLYQGYKDAAMKVTMNADDSITSAKKMMADDGWVKSSHGTWKRAGGGGAAAGGPTKGTVVDGFEFQGGNPNDKASWKAVAK